MYVIAGASGNTGSVVAEELLARGENVRLIARDPAKLKAFAGRAEIVVAELDDRDALTTALKGAKGAYLLVPPNMVSDDTRTDNRARTEVIAQAIDASGAPHVVFLSSIAAQEQEGTGPILSVHDAELRLRQVKAAVTFVRAAYFVENLASSFFALDKGILPTFLRLDKAIAMVSTRDIGKAAATALLEGAKAGAKEVIELSGPKDLTPGDVAAALSKVLGRTITAQLAPEDAIVPALLAAGQTAHRAELYREMIHGLNTENLGWEGGAARAVRGTTPIETTLARMLAATPAR